VSGPRAVYYDHGREASLQPLFPRGEAGSVTVDDGGEWSVVSHVAIGPNSHCALLQHGVAERLNALARIAGVVGSGRDALLSPAGCEDAARIFYDADRKTYGARYDFVARVQELPERIDFRIAIDNREYQRTLSQLQFLTSTAARHGHGLRIRL
jgi:hypothetical protein